MKEPPITNACMVKYIVSIYVFMATFLGGLPLTAFIHEAEASKITCNDGSVHNYPDQDWACMQEGGVDFDAGIQPYDPSLPTGRQPSGSSVSGTTAQTNDTIDQTCQTEGGRFGWAICYIVEDIILESLDKFATEVESRLVLDSIDDDYRGVWGAIRNIANVVFVIVLLFVIFSQALVGRF